MMTDAIKIFKGSKHYSELLDSFSCGATLERGDNKDISEAIYFHIFKMKYAGWQHKVNFKRGRKHSFSDFFQDIIAFYLKASLPKGYEVKLESKEGKTQPDIAIKRGGNYIFLIEAKTNVGWARLNDKPAGRKAIEAMRKRVVELRNNFKVPEKKKNIIYIFEEHSNVSEKFSAKYWDGGKRKTRPDFSMIFPLFDATDPNVSKEVSAKFWDGRRSKTRPKNFPFSIIYPLFDATDPYYWKWEGFDITTRYPIITDEQILDRAKRSIVTPFEEILRMIIES